MYFGGIGSSSLHCSSLHNQNSDRYWKEAACHLWCDHDVDCPRGWGNYESYDSYQPGCYRGTYYTQNLEGTDFIAVIVSFLAWAKIPTFLHLISVVLIFHLLLVFIVIFVLKVSMMELPLSSVVLILAIFLIRLLAVLFVVICIPTLL